MNESSGPVCAVLDLGSNSFHLLIGRLAGGRLVTLDRRKDMVRLAQGLQGDGCLAEPVMARALDSLAVFSQQLRNIPRANVRVVGTNTLRAARNADVFLERAEKIIGVPIDVISGQEEGRLIFLGVAKGHASNAIRRLVVDIGGGSTELVWIDLAGVDPIERSRAIMGLHRGFEGLHTGAARVVDWISVPLGVATLKDQFQDVEDDGARFALMSWFFEENLSSFSPYNAAQPREGFQIIGTSGTVTTVAASHLGLRRYDRTKVDGLEMTSDQIDAVIRDYLSLGPEGRRTDPRIGRDRHTLIMSGAAILQALMRIWPTDRLSVADRGLREGLLYAQMNADGVLEDGPKL